MPVAQRVMLGDLLAALIARVNAQEQQLAALTAGYRAALVKLDAEAALATHGFVADNGVPAYVAASPVALLDPAE